MWSQLQSQSHFEKIDTNKFSLNFLFYFSLCYLMWCRGDAWYRQISIDDSLPIPPQITTFHQKYFFNTIFFRRENLTYALKTHVSKTLFRNTFWNTLSKTRFRSLF
jgi:hypothetical protein